MEYKLKIEETLCHIETESPDANGSATAIVDGAARTIQVGQVLNNRFTVSIDGRTVVFFAVRVDEGTWVWVDGGARLVQDADFVERRRTRGHAEGPRDVTPPTPASVVRVLVETGQWVEKGEGLVVVSAMKMEITLAAPYSGIVRSVNAAPGDQVKPGDILVEIDEPSEESSNE